jgi:RNA polymerase sigma-70 factor (ECF subfamily)
MALNETDLIIKAQKGDSSAFEELIYKYDKNVLSLALKYVGSSDDAKDIYQEVFIRVFKSLKNFQFRSEFSTWLYRITTNVCLTFKKAKNRYSSVSIYDEDETGNSEFKEFKSDEKSSPHSYTENSELSKVLNDALENLSPKQKLSFILKNYEGYKIREIAVMLDCGEGTIKKYLFDANSKMRKYLNEFYN